VAKECPVANGDTNFYFSNENPLFYCNLFSGWFSLEHFDSIKITTPTNSFWVIKMSIPRTKTFKNWFIKIKTNIRCRYYLLYPWIIFKIFFIRVQITIDIFDSFCRSSNPAHINLNRYRYHYSIQSYITRKLFSWILIWLQSTFSKKISAWWIKIGVGGPRSCLKNESSFCHRFFFK